MESSSSSGDDVRHESGRYLPPIPVVLRHPFVVASVKQLRSEAQTEHLQQHIVSESFIPMAPNLTKPPRRRRRPPFSYSSLIAQAILESENERMTLRDIYSWITNKYPALYSAEDTGWQNTIRHNLSLNRCFRKIAKSELEGTPNHRGKGGYWTIDPNHMAKFKNGAFARGSTTLLRRKAHGHETPILPNTPSTTIHEHLPMQPSIEKHSEPCPTMQIHNLLN
ncbi:hypothetical protein K501DRAFT_219200 [Backusella circina FSU 941]|nr:hypothetical protein K501DRAFT_219200 [Backusella circina FSU 941]